MHDEAMIANAIISIQLDFSENSMNQKFLGAPTLGPQVGFPKWWEFSHESWKSSAEKMWLKWF